MIPQDLLWQPKQHNQPSTLGTTIYGDVTNFASAWTGPLGLIESSGVAASQELASEYRDATLAASHLAQLWRNIWTYESPSFRPTQNALIADLLAPSMSDLWTSLGQRLLEALTQLTAADADEPVYEAGPYRVDWNRLRRLREARAEESTDLFEWYAQQE